MCARSIDYHVIECTLLPKKFASCRFPVSCREGTSAQSRNMSSPPLYGNFFFLPLQALFYMTREGFSRVSITRKLGRYEGKNFNQTFIPRKLVQIPSSKSHRIPAAHAQSAKVPKIFTRSAAIRKIFMHMFLISTIKSVIAIDTRGH